MEKIKKMCGFLSSNIAVLIIIFSVIAFFYPKGFSWATSYTTWFLGAAMFGMGLTIKTEDFKVVFTRPLRLLRWQRRSGFPLIWRWALFWWGAVRAERQATSLPMWRTATFPFPWV